jgi:MFS family permease
MLWYFVVVRGIAGFGVGGEYPPSAAAGIEETNDVSISPYLALIILLIY